jgi:hypothetical protein
MLLKDSNILDSMYMRSRQPCANLVLTQDTKSYFYLVVLIIAKNSTKKSCLHEYQSYTNKTSFNIKYTEFIPQYSEEQSWQLGWVGKQIFTYSVQIFKYKNSCGASWFERWDELAKRWGELSGIHVRITYN